ncbi:MAG: phosphotransferase [Alphaproteobacteria bacterium]|nr:phosphotransferase [Alphaproteobacteria bacterium]
MSERHFDLGEKVLRNLEARGEAGRAWLATLPAQVIGLERAWGITVGAAFPRGTEAFAAEAVLADGTLAAIKIPIPGADKQGREARVLAAAEGRGYARLLSHDPATGALLLERLGPQLAQFGFDMDKQISIICDTLKNTWATPSRDLGLLTGAQKADALAGDIHRVRAKHPAAASDRVATVALRFCDARRAAFDPAHAIIAHGDAHAWNLLSDNAGGYKFVDPDGLFIERAHDLSISLREGVRDFLAGDPVARGRACCAYISKMTGVAPEPIWQWGLIENLVNGLLYVEVGSPEHAAMFLDVAEAWAAAEPD